MDIPYCVRQVHAEGCPFLDQGDLYVPKLSVALRWIGNGSLPLQIAVLMSALGCSFSHLELAEVAGSKRSILTIAPWIAFKIGSLIHIDLAASRNVDYMYLKMSNRTNQHSR